MCKRKKILQPTLYRHIQAEKEQDTNNTHKRPTKNVFHPQKQQNKHIQTYKLQIKYKIYRQTHKRHVSDGIGNTDMISVQRTSISQIK